MKASLRTGIKDYPSKNQFPSAGGVITMLAHETRCDTRQLFRCCQRGYL